MKGRGDMDDQYPAGILPMDSVPPVSHSEGERQVPGLLPGCTPATAAVTRLVMGFSSLSAPSQKLMMKHAHCCGTLPGYVQVLVLQPATRAGTGARTGDMKAHHRALPTFCS